MGNTKEIRSTIEQFFQAMDTQDNEAMTNLIPKQENMVHIGTDVGEIWKGRDVLMKATREQFENLEYYKAEVYDLTVNFSATGNTAWYFHLLDAEIKSGGKVIRWEKARFTGVLEKREGS